MSEKKFVPPFTVTIIDWSDETSEQPQKRVLGVFTVQADAEREAQQFHHHSPEDVDQENRKIHHRDIDVEVRDGAGQTVVYYGGD